LNSPTKEKYNLPKKASSLRLTSTVEFDGRRESRTTIILSTSGTRGGRERQWGSGGDTEIGGDADCKTNPRVLSLSYVRAARKDKSNHTHTHTNRFVFTLRI